MTASSADLLRVAERLDEWPMELLNGGAVDALSALDASAPEVQAVANTRGIELSTVNALWERAAARVREVPEPDEVFAAAAEAAGLLYAAAWVMDSDSATTQDLRDLL